MTFARKQLFTHQDSLGYFSKRANGGDAKGVDSESGAGATMKLLPKNPYIPILSTRKLATFSMLIFADMQPVQRLQVEWQV